LGNPAPGGDPMIREGKTYGRDLIFFIRDALNRNWNFDTSNEPET
jgi:hypothetical protein